MQVPTSDRNQTDAAHPSVAALDSEAEDLASWSQHPWQIVVTPFGDCAETLRSIGVPAAGLDEPDYETTLAEALHDAAEPCVALVDEAQRQAGDLEARGIACYGVQTPPPFAGPSEYLTRRSEALDHQLTAETMRELWAHVCESAVKCPGTVDASRMEAEPVDGPVIRHLDMSLHAVIDRCIEALAKVPDLRVRAGRLVRVVTDANGEVLRAVELETGAVRELLSRHLTWMDGRGEEARQVWPQMSIAQALAEPRASWPASLRVLRDDDAPVRDAADVARDVIPPPIVNRLVPTAGLVVIGAAANAGKTMLVLDMAMRLAHGLPSWLGLKIPAPAAVLYLAGEGHSGIPKRLRAWLAAHPGARPVPGCYLAMRDSAPNLAADDAAEQLLAVFDETAADHSGNVPAVVVLDTWSTCLPGGDQNETAVATNALGAIAALQRRRNCAVVVLHHVRKSGNVGTTKRVLGLDDLRGSSGLAGAADVVAIVDDGAMRLVKNRDDAGGEPLPFLIVSQDTGWPGEVGAIVVEPPTCLPVPQAVVDAARNESDMARIIDAVRQLDGTPTTRESVAQVSGIRAVRARAMVDLALASGFIEEYPSGHRKVIYSVVGEASPSRRPSPSLAVPDGGGVGSPSRRPAVPPPVGGDGGRDGERRTPDAKQIGSALQTSGTAKSIDNGQPERPKRRRRQRKGGAR